MTVPFPIFTPWQRPTLEDLMCLGLFEGGVEGLRRKSGNRPDKAQVHRRGVRIYFLILTLVNFISCSTNKNLTSEQLIGKYQWNGVYGVQSIIELKADMTFEYQWKTGLMSGTTFGAWRRERNKIILNSALQPPVNRIEDFEIVSTEVRKSDSLSIKVIDTESIPVFFAACVLKTDTTTLTGARTNFQGDAKLPRLKADSLIISYVGYKPIRIPLDGSISHYEFKMKRIHEYYEYFTNERWAYKTGRLYDSSIKKDQYVKKDYYERTE